MNIANAAKSKDMYDLFAIASYKNNTAKTRYAYCKICNNFIVNLLTVVENLDVVKILIIRLYK
jgi:hypothetical protein